MQTWCHEIFGAKSFPSRVIQHGGHTHPPTVLCTVQQGFFFFWLWRGEVAAYRNFGTEGADAARALWRSWCNDGEAQGNDSFLAKRAGPQVRPGRAARSCTVRFVCCDSAAERYSALRHSGNFCLPTSLDRSFLDSLCTSQMSIRTSQIFWACLPPGRPTFRFSCLSEGKYSGH